MDPALLELLRCPVTRQPLRLVPAEQAAALGLGTRQILLREDGRVGYPFDDHGFPLLLPDSGVPVADRPDADGADAAGRDGPDAHRS